MQTPLISKEYIKDIPWKRFIVCSDSLAPIMWRGYDLICVPAHRSSQLTKDKLIVVECGVVSRKRSSYQVGFFKSFSRQALTMDYQSERLYTPAEGEWQVPRWQIRSVWLVDKVVRDYAHMHKFYPYAGYGN